MKSNKNIINGNCWVAYFDILGFKSEIQLYTGHLDAFVKTQYEEILQRIERDKKDVHDFTPQEHDYCCFSDSFIFYILDDSINSYLTMCFVATSFFQHLVMLKWPVTGALTVGDFYADKAKNIYLGEALIEAHGYTEKQDWIGLVLTPNARTKLAKNGHDLFIFADGLDFREYNVPTKRWVPANGKKSVEFEHEKLFAHAYKKDDCRHSLIVDWMKSVHNNKETEYRRKYENTLRFYEEIS